MNVLEMNYLRCLVGVSRMDRFGNEEVCRTAGIRRELASRYCDWLGMWKERMSSKCPEWCRC